MSHTALLKGVHVARDYLLRSIKGVSVTQSQCPQCRFSDIKIIMSLSVRFTLRGLWPKMKIPVALPQELASISSYNDQVRRPRPGAPVTTRG